MKYEPEVLFVRNKLRPVWAYKRHRSRFSEIFPNFAKELQRRYNNSLAGKIESVFVDSILSECCDDMLLHHFGNNDKPNASSVRFHRYGDLSYSEAQ